MNTISEGKAKEQTTEQETHFMLVLFSGNNSK